MAGKWDKGLAKEICSWIQRATGVSVPSDDPSDFAEELKNGQTLCQYGLFVVFVTFQGHPTTILGRISVRKTI